jgi:signal transduction histidine kinase
MSRHNRSLPSQISLVVLGLAGSLVALYSLLILTYAWVIEDNIFNRLVAAEAQRMAASYELDGVVETPQSNFITLHPDWRDVPATVQSAYSRDPTHIEHTLIDGGTVYINVTELGGVDYVLVADVEGFEVSQEFLPGLLRWLLVLGLATSAIVSLLAYLAARRITQPVTRLAVQVEALSRFETLDGFAAQYPDNEVRTLALAVEHSFGDLQKALEREQNFTRDISHEMRTPITVVKTTLEATGSAGSLSGEALARVGRAGQDLEQLTETLLALARAESAEKHTLIMKEEIEDAVLQHFELNHTERGQRLEIRLQLAPDVHVEANNRLVRILLDNLISNAVRYATDPVVAFTLTPSGMSFSNRAGKPVPDHPERSGVKSSDSPGIGQGLSLVSRICSTTGWRLSSFVDRGSFTVSIQFE